MGNVPAICNVCGMLFKSSYGISNSSDVYMLNNKAQSCPKCGNTLKIVDGNYSMAEDIVEIRAMDPTIDLNQFKLLLESYEGNVKIEDVEKDIKENHPRFKQFIPVLKKYMSNGAKLVDVIYKLARTLEIFDFQ